MLTTLARRRSAVAQDFALDYEVLYRELVRHIHPETKR